MGRTVRTGIGLAIVAVVALFVGRLIISVAGGSPVIGGLNPSAERGGCPGTPNCVSSYATTEAHAIDPIACDAPPDVAIAAFSDAIDTLPDVESTSGTAWIVYSRIMKFPDDVRIEVTERGIEVISGSRLGAGDLGVNRNRVEYLRDLVEEDPRCSDEP